MAPARAVQLIRPHGPGHESEKREALPRVAVVLLFGLLGYELLGHQIAALLGAELPFWRSADVGHRSCRLCRRRRPGMVSQPARQSVSASVFQGIQLVL